MKNFLETLSNLFIANKTVNGSGKSQTVIWVGFDMVGGKIVYFYSYF